MNSKIRLTASLLLFATLFSTLQAGFQPAEPETVKFVKQTLLEAGYDQKTVDNLNVGYSPKGFACKATHILVPITDKALKALQEQERDNTPSTIEQKNKGTLKLFNTLHKKVDKKQPQENNTKEKFDDLKSMLNESIIDMKWLSFFMNVSSLDNWRGSILHEMGHYKGHHGLKTALTRDIPIILFLLFGKHSILFSVRNHNGNWSFSCPGLGSYLLNLGGAILTGIGLSRLLDYYHEYAADQEVIKNAPNSQILWELADEYATTAYVTNKEKPKSWIAKLQKFFNQKSPYRFVNFMKKLFGFDQHPFHEDRAEYFINAALKAEKRQKQSA